MTFALLHYNKGQSTPPLLIFYTYRGQNMIFKKALREIQITKFNLIGFWLASSCTDRFKHVPALSARGHFILQ